MLPIAAAIYDDGTLTSGEWTPGPLSATLTGVWGEFRVEVGATWDVSVDPPAVDVSGTDITDLVEVDDLLFGENWGPLSGQISVTAADPLARPAWLTRMANVDVWHVLADGVTEIPYWHGFIASVERAEGVGNSGGLRLQLSGCAIGEASARDHQPIMRDAAHDAGQWINYALEPEQYSRPYTPMVGFAFEAVPTGITLRNRGSRGSSETDYVEEILALAQKPNAAWSVAQAYSGEYPQARKLSLRLKQESFADPETVIQQSHAWATGYGVSLSLSEDWLEYPNAVWGEGVSPKDKSRWRNAKYPELFPAQPAYPDRVTGATYPLTFGDADGDFTADVITQLQYGLRLGGWPDVQITGVYDEDTEIAVYSMKDSATGVTASIDIESNADWDLVWETGTTVSDIDSGFFRPLSEVSEATAYTYAANGAVTGTNDAWDKRIRVEQTISYGDVSKERARLHARRIATQAIDDAPHIGTITLAADVVDDLGNARSRMDIRAGGWLRLHDYMDGHRDFFIASTHVRDSGRTVTLTVAEHSHDLLDLMTRIKRNKDAKSDPAKAFYNMRTRTRRPFKDVLGWDKEAGSGIVQETSCPANTWTVIRFVASQTGTIEAIKATTKNSACTFAFAVFGKEVSASSLSSLIANPLAEETDNYGWWSHPDNVATLDSWYFVESWGEYLQAAGYYPGAENRDGTATTHPVTGKMVDSLGWQFASDDPPYLWLAVYPTSACTFSATMRVIADE